MHQTLEARGKQVRIPLGPVMLRWRGHYVEKDLCRGLWFDGPGCGIWRGASMFRFELGIPGLGSSYIDLNVNTGIGIRDSNFEAHLFGFGCCIGEDGLQIDTFIGGACCKSLSWPINLIMSWYRTIDEVFLYVCGRWP